MAEAVRQEYLSLLADLTCNSKPHINVMTMFAQENIACAPVIVETIECHIKEVQQQRKLPVLYLIDSIIKNCKSSTYCELFAKNIVKLFIGVFEQVDDKTRQAMHKLRQTWNNFFPQSKLYHLDCKLRELDPGWPISSISSYNAQGSDDSQPPPVTVCTVGSGAVRQQERRIRKLLKNEIQKKMMELQRVGSEKVHTVFVADDADIAELSQETIPGGLFASDSFVAALNSNAKLPPKKRKIGGVTNDDQGDVLSGGSDPESFEPNDKRSKLFGERDKDMRVPTATAGAGYRSGISLVSERGSNLRPAEIAGALSKATSPGVVGSTAKNDGRVVRTVRGTVVSKIVTNSTMLSSIKEKTAEISEEQSLRSCGRKPPQHVEKARPALNHKESESLGGIVSTSSVESDRQAKAAPLEAPQQQSSGAEDAVESSADAAATIPKNKTIFVDGRAYEVQYIRDVAVIEKDGMPHRVFFMGHPRDIIIDGVAHTLPFGEKKTVLIDGQPFTVAFGGPSREFLLGGYAFRGSFGGPPILATISGIPHKIQLCGPPPEVKIDPEADYELARFMKTQQQQEQTARPPAATFAGIAAVPLQSQLRLTRPPPPVQQMVLPPTPLSRPVLAAPHGSGMLGRPVSEVSAMVAPPFGWAPPPPIGAAPFQHPQVSVTHPFAANDQSVHVLPQQSQAIVSASSSQQIPVNELLKKLSGFIPALVTPASKAASDSSAMPASSSGSANAQEIPLPTQEITEKSGSTKQNMPALEELNIRELSVRYEVVVNCLHPTGQQCGTCGLRFSETALDKYSKHLDWHFQLNKRDKDKRSQARLWYLVSDDWINYEEMTEEAVAKAKSTVFEHRPVEPEDLSQDQDYVVLAATEDQACKVCGERFEQFYDEDEEQWKCRNALKISDLYYHPVCYQDIRDTSISAIHGSHQSLAVQRSAAGEESANDEDARGEVREEGGDEDEDDEQARGQTPLIDEETTAPLVQSAQSPPIKQEASESAEATESS